jgi:hypothetical protein
LHTIRGAVGNARCAYQALWACHYLFNGYLLFERRKRLSAYLHHSARLRERLRPQAFHQFDVLLLSAYTVGGQRFASIIAWILNVKVL